MINRRPYEASGLVRGKEDRLLRRALREDWPLSAEQKRKIIERMAEIAIDPNHSARDAARAAAVLVTCRKNDNDKLLKVLDKVSPDQHALTGTVNHNHREVVQELLREPEYVDFLRQADSDPSLVCTNGHAGNGKPLDDGHTRNGHRP